MHGLRCSFVRLSHVRLAALYDRFLILSPSRISHEVRHSLRAVLPVSGTPNTETSANRAVTSSSLIDQNKTPAAPLCNYPLHARGSDLYTSCHSHGSTVPVLDVTKHSTRRMPKSVDASTSLIDLYKEAAALLECSGESVRAAAVRVGLEKCAGHAAGASSSSCTNLSSSSSSSLRSSAVAQSMSPPELVRPTTPDEETNKAQDNSSICTRASYCQSSALLADACSLMTTQQILKRARALCRHATTPQGHSTMLCSPASVACHTNKDDDNHTSSTHQEIDEITASETSQHSAQTAHHPSGKYALCYSDDATGDDVVRPTSGSAAQSTKLQIAEQQRAIFDTLLARDEWIALTQCLQCWHQTGLLSLFTHQPTPTELIRAMSAMQGDTQLSTPEVVAKPNDMFAVMAAALCERANKRLHRTNDRSAAAVWWCKIRDTSPFVFARMLLSSQTSAAAFVQAAEQYDGVDNEPMRRKEACIDTERDTSGRNKLSSVSIMASDRRVLDDRQHTMTGTHDELVSEEESTAAATSSIRMTEESVKAAQVARVARATVTELCRVARQHDDQTCRSAELRATVCAAVAQLLRAARASTRRDTRVHKQEMLHLLTMCTLSLTHDRAASAGATGTAAAATSSSYHQTCPPPLTKSTALESTQTLTPSEWTAAATVDMASKDATGAYRVNSRACSVCSKAGGTHEHARRIDAEAWLSVARRSVRLAVESSCSIMLHNEAQVRFVGLSCFARAACALQQVGEAAPNALMQCLFLCLACPAMTEMQCAFQPTSSTATNQPSVRGNTEPNTSKVSLLQRYLIAEPTQRWRVALALLREARHRQSFRVTAAHLRRLLSGLQSISIRQTWQQALHCIEYCAKPPLQIAADDASVSLMLLNLKQADWRRAFEVLRVYEIRQTAPPVPLLRELHLVAATHGSWVTAMRVMSELMHCRPSEQCQRRVGADRDADDEPAHVVGRAGLGWQGGGGAGFMNYAYCLYATGRAGQSSLCVQLFTALGGGSVAGGKGESAYNELTVALPGLAMMDAGHAAAMVRFARAVRMRHGTAGAANCMPDASKNYSIASANRLLDSARSSRKSTTNDIARTADTYSSRGSTSSHVNHGSSATRSPTTTAPESTMTLPTSLSFSPAVSRVPISAVAAEAKLTASGWEMAMAVELLGLLMDHRDTALTTLLAQLTHSAAAASTATPHPTRASNSSTEPASGLIASASICISSALAASSNALSLPVTDAHSNGLHRLIALQGVLEAALRLRGLCGMGHLHAPVRLVFDTFARGSYSYAQRDGKGQLRRRRNRGAMYITEAHLMRAARWFAQALGGYVYRTRGEKDRNEKANSNSADDISGDHNSHGSSSRDGSDENDGAIESDDAVSQTLALFMTSKGVGPEYLRAAVLGKNDDT